MFKKSVRLLIIIPVCLSIGCASIRTQSDLHDVSPISSKIAYDKCSLGAGNVVNFIESDTTHINPDTQRQISVLQNVEKLLKDYGHCKQVVITDPIESQYQGAVDIKEFEKALNEKSELSDKFQINFYEHRISQRHPPMLLVYLVYTAVYTLSLGLVPMYMPAETNMWVAIQKPLSKEIKVYSLDNSGSVWLWSPFYFRKDWKKSYENLSTLQTEMRSESFQKGVNIVGEGS